MSKLKRDVCERCLESTGSTYGCLNLDGNWTNGNIPCPPDFILISHESAYQYCHKRPQHEGCAVVRSERKDSCSN